MDTEAATAAAAATVVTEPENLSRMMVSFVLQFWHCSGFPHTPRTGPDGSVCGSGLPPSFVLPAAAWVLRSVPEAPARWNTAMRATCVALLQGISRPALCACQERPQLAYVIERF